MTVLIVVAVLLGVLALIVLAARLAVRRLLTVTPLPELGGNEKSPLKENASAILNAADPSRRRTTHARAR